MTDEPSPQNDIDFLMSLNPLDYQPGDIDVIIAYQRKYRAQLEAGVKPARPKSAPAAGKIDLAKLIGGASVVIDDAPKPASAGVRRI